MNRCIKCGSIMNDLLIEGIYRKKCSDCGTTNYRIKVFDGGSNAKIYSVGTKQEREKEKQKRDSYYKWIFPYLTLKDAYGEDIYNKSYKELQERYNLPDPIYTLDEGFDKKPDIVNLKYNVAYLKMVDQFNKNEIVEALGTNLKLMRMAVDLFEKDLVVDLFAQYVYNLFYENFHRGYHQLGLIEMVYLDYDDAIKKSLTAKPLIKSIAEDRGIHPNELKNRFLDKFGNEVLQLGRSRTAKCIYMDPIEPDEK